VGTSSLTLLIAQAASGTEVVAGGRIESVWDFVIKGGPTMAVIVLCSLVALTVIVERAIVLRKRWVAPPDFAKALRALGGDRGQALEFCRANGSPLANVLAAAIQRRGESREAVERGVRDAGQREMVHLRARMRLLGALPQVATMLGLLGTIFGMIKTFQAVATSGQALGKTELLARGIFEAWTNTAAGLLVAIPILIAYQTLMGRVDAMAVELDRIACDWIEQDRGSVPVAARRETINPTPAVAEAALAVPAAQ
jgi:biopolymer transport protein ExbB